jgi:hypothetical protein
MIRGMGKRIMMMIVHWHSTPRPAASLF